MDRPAQIGLYTATESMAALQLDDSDETHIIWNFDTGRRYEVLSGRCVGTPLLSEPLLFVLHVRHQLHGFRPASLRPDAPGACLLKNISCIEWVSYQGGAKRYLSTLTGTPLLFDDEKVKIEFSGVTLEADPTLLRVPDSCSGVLSPEKLGNVVNFLWIFFLFFFLLRMGQSPPSPPLFFPFVILLISDFVGVDPPQVYFRLVHLLIEVCLVILFTRNIRLATPLPFAAFLPAIASFLIFSVLIGLFTGPVAAGSAAKFLTAFEASLCVHAMLTVAFGHGLLNGLLAGHSLSVAGSKLCCSFCLCLASFLSPARQVAAGRGGTLLVLSGGDGVVRVLWLLVLAGDAAYTYALWKRLQAEQASSAKSLV
eukprot:gnl/Hemi2/16095_TR5341_c0_g1_i4.p1 gnl/Hemi2/16095_TR5341_c0_g1~~gnl/Hemi2/16095_TR5341_c0_g1_i4.p1  ORF type:complete len:368 (-),score=95.57 gnl/Hemi2/16095_TR5341_c0_g1_i4:46-1149(-)